MAYKDGIGQNGRKKSRKLTYFYLNGNLHRSLHINRGADTIIAWCYPLEKRVAYTYSDVKKNKRPAFSTKEAGSMLNRGRIALEHAILDGNIKAPQFTYGLNEHKRKFKYMWSEDDVIAAHRYFQTVHRGRPRNDGRVTPAAMPTERELRALMRNEHILYVQRDDGEFVPVWKAQDFS